MVFVTIAPNVASCCRGKHMAVISQFGTEKKGADVVDVWAVIWNVAGGNVSKMPLTEVEQGLAVWRSSMALVCLVQKSIQNSLAKESQISGWVKLRLPKSPKWMLQCKTDQFCGSHWYTLIFLIHSQMLFLLSSQWCASEIRYVWAESGGCEGEKHPAATETLNHFWVIS